MLFSTDKNLSINPIFICNRSKVGCEMEFLIQHLKMVKSGVNLLNGKRSIKKKAQNEKYTITILVVTYNNVYPYCYVYPND